MGRRRKRKQRRKKRRKREGRGREGEEKEQKVLLSTLQLYVQCGEGLQTHHVVHHTCRVAVVGAVVKLLYRP